jgi:hypothetical protein
MCFATVVLVVADRRRYRTGLCKFRLEFGTDRPWFCQFRFVYIVLGGSAFRSARISLANGRVVLSPHNFHLSFCYEPRAIIAPDYNLQRKDETKFTSATETKLVQKEVPRLGASGEQVTGVKRFWYNRGLWARSRPRWQLRAPFDRYRRFIDGAQHNELEIRRGIVMGTSKEEPRC